MDRGWLIGGVALVGVALLVMSRRAMSAAMTTTQTYDPMFQQAAATYGLPDWRMAKATAMIESSLDPTAVNDSDPGNPSYGLMQISCRPDPAGVAACDPYQFIMPGWPPASLADLMDPQQNIDYGTYILAQNIERYGVLRGVAVYNDYAARNSPPGGPFPNQTYVDRWLSAYHSIGGAYV